MKKKIFIILICYFSILSAKDMQIDGLLESYHAWKTNESGELMGERNRLRLNFRKRESKLYMLASFRARQNQFVNDGNPQVELHEAYMEYFSSNWDMRIGRQIFNWGKADGIRVTDVLSPCDYTEYITRDFDEIRIPVESVKFHYLFPVGDLEMVWVPYFTPAVLPESSTSDIQNPWYIAHTFSAVPTDNYPSRKLKNSEVAMQYSMYLSGIDMTLSSAYVFDDSPVYKLSGNEITAEYNRLLVSGASLSGSLAEFVIRMETVFIQGKYFQVSDNDLVAKSNSAKALIGIDWYPGNLWTVSMQLANSQFIFDHDDKFYDDENNYIATLNLNKKLFREKLEIENMLFFGFEEQDLFERINISYSLTDNFRLAGGIDYFDGDGGNFGRYDDNDSFWLKATYNF